MKTKTTFDYLKWSLAITAIGIIAAAVMGGFKAALIVSVLIVLETSLSFDNAVVNATVLKDMDEKWRRRFLTWGILIAVFGMRIVFPLAIVGIVASLGPVAVIDMAANRPDEYAAVISSAYHQIAAFGGAFLAMVFLKFFVDHNKDTHWFHAIEAPLTRLGKMEAVEVAVTLLALLVSASFMEDQVKMVEFVIAGVWGLVAYIIADGLGGLLGAEEGEGATTVAKTGFAGFMYLELLDASFSFDGVIGAFALTTNLAIIATGLGIGALFVRSFTLLLVDRGTLAEYRFLEHGAFWAIGALASVMLLSVHFHVPEVFTGLAGGALIGLSFWSSVRANRKDANNPAVAG